MKDIIDQGLDYVKLDRATSHIVLVTDAIFANAKDVKIQLGLLVIMVDGSNNLKILHFDCNRCRHFARSVMAEKLFAPILGFANAYVIRDLSKQLTVICMALDALIDSKTVFDLIAKRSKSSEKRLQIYFLSLWENYDC